MIAQILLRILTVIGKTLGTKAAPGVFIVLAELANVGKMLVTISTDFSLQPAEKTELYESNLRSLKEAIAIAEEQGEILASDIPAIALAVAGAEVKSALNIP